MTGEVPAPLSPIVFHILLALSEAPGHGYAIMRAVDESARGSLSIGPGMIYGSLQRMERDSLVHERSDAGDRRRTFELTRDGRRALVDESARLARLADLARGKGLVRAE